MYTERFVWLLSDDDPKTMSYLLGKWFDFATPTECFVIPYNPCFRTATISVNMPVSLKFPIDLPLLKA